MAETTLEPLSPDQAQKIRNQEAQKLHSKMEGLEKIIAEQTSEIAAMKSSAAENVAGTDGRLTEVLTKLEGLASSDSSSPPTPALSDLLAEVANLRGSLSSKSSSAASSDSADEQIAQMRKQLESMNSSLSEKTRSLLVFQLLQETNLEVYDPRYITGDTREEILESIQAEASKMVSLKEKLLKEQPAAQNPMTETPEQPQSSNPTQAPPVSENPAGNIVPEQNTVPETGVVPQQLQQDPTYPGPGNTGPGPDPVGGLDAQSRVDAYLAAPRDQQLAMYRGDPTFFQAVAEQAARQSVLSGAR